MDDAASSRGFACTLDEREFRIRDDEFRSLFARHLRTIERADERTALLQLDLASESDLRALLAREKQCCSFFEFDVQAAADVITLAVQVPAGSEAALAFLLSLKPATIALASARVAR